jgi:molybdate transport system substrate-binding protein
VTLTFDTSGRVLQRALAGAGEDVFAGALEAMEELGRKDIARSPLPVGSSRIAIGVRQGETAPDTSTVAAFKAALLGAGRVARGDPAGGGTAGRHLAQALEDLGLAEAMRDKSVLRVGGYNVMAAVVAGEADFGITQSTEIPPSPGAAIGGWLPEAIQLTTVYAVAASARARPAAAALESFLRSPEGAACFRAAGFS